MTAGAGCTWTASSSAAWVTVTSGASGTGNGSVGVQRGGQSRQRPHGHDRGGGPDVHGDAGGASVLHLFDQSRRASPCPRREAPAPFAVSAAPAAPGRRAATTAWITLTSGASGTGNGSVAFSVSGPQRQQARTGTITVAGQTFTVNAGGRARLLHLHDRSTKCLVRRAGRDRDRRRLHRRGCDVDGEQQRRVDHGHLGRQRHRERGRRVQRCRESAGARTGTITVAGRTFTVNQAAVLGLDGQSGESGSIRHER